MPTPPATHATPNHLAHETSPYLLQHLFNPVDWHPWNDDSLTKARNESKLIVISIGYSACHWCHVMERESFEDEEVAALMNRHYVSIKVDREERPDIDAIYMDAVQAMAGQGGWPLNVVALPDGRPIWGGTYFPKPHWLHYLGQIAQLWQEKPTRFLDQADRLMGYMKRIEEVPAPAPDAAFGADDLAKAFIPLSARFDAENGGFEGAPKFPTPANWVFTLRYAHFSDDAAAQRALEATLRGLAWGGIFDHVGGGFARYSVDDRWHVPHFEKMLYDNAQLVSLYAEAYRRSPNPMYKQVVEQTLAFAERELLAPTGGFYSALDADAEGVEGKFYVWTDAEINEALGPDASIYKTYYNVKDGAGNWEHGQNVLMRTRTDEDLALRLGIAPEALRQLVQDANLKLLALRGHRVGPGLDNKLLTSWNGLMCKALVDAFRTFGDARHLELAVNNAVFIQQNLKDSETHRLCRNYTSGRATINAFLDDYAFTIEALLALYQATFKEAYLHEADAYAQYVLAHFADPETAVLWYTSGLDSPLISRKREVYDSVLPSSNSTMAHNLLTLGLLLDKPDYTMRAKQMLATLRQHVEKHLGSFSGWGALMMRFAFPDYAVAFVGPRALELRAEWDKAYVPNSVVCGAETAESLLPLLQNRFAEGQTLIYVCTLGACMAPVPEVNQALGLVNGAR